MFCFFVVRAVIYAPKRNTLQKRYKIKEGSEITQSKETTYNACSSLFSLHATTIDLNKNQKTTSSKLANEHLLQLENENILPTRTCCELTLYIA
mmetsp:Transcript_6114/g.7539  ORF Transcript_6114/g.7539 Transcript_6114/m.7539 type:complete len:94 (-) Transcript_6114:89-370(-)